MKMHSIKVRGAIGFKKGLGVDEIKVDLKGLSGLVALAGPNGHGKTTLLESLSPYRMFASRPGALHHHFFLKDSFRDLTFEFGGDIYRTLVKVNSNSDRSEGFIWKNGESLVDGKATTYSRYIENLLGSSTLFYNSVFCAQNSDQMSDLTTSELKKLFVEFLRLDRLARYEVMAKQCVGSLNGAALQQERVIASLQERLNGFQGVEADIKEVEDGKRTQEGLLSTVKTSIEAHVEEVDRLKEIEAKNSVNIERRDDLEKDLTAIRSENLSRYETYSKERLALEEEVAAKKTTKKESFKVLEDKQAIVQAADKVRELEEELTQVHSEDQELAKTLEGLFSEGQAITPKIQGIKDDIQGVENNASRKEIDATAIGIHQAMESIQKQMDDINSKRHVMELNLTNQESGKQTEIKSCKDSMALLDQRGECPVTEPNCAFVQSALSAKKRLVGLEKDLAQISEEGGKKIADLDAKQDALQGEYDEKFLALRKTAFLDHSLKLTDDETLSELRDKVSQLEIEQVNLRNRCREIQGQRRAKVSTVERLESDKKRHQGLADRLPEVQGAETQVAQLEKEIQALESSMQEKQDRYNKEDLSARTKQRKMEKRLDEIKAMIDEEVAEKLEAAQKKHTIEKNRQAELEQDIKTKTECIAVLTQRLEERSSVETDLEAAQTELGRVTSESAQWLYLQNACGKGGLQALEIDGVAPLITGYANDLLTSSFGPNFSVRLDTQDPETGKEILDIVVIRGDGSETRLENLSGGEKVWVLKSLRLAMTLVSKQKSSRNFQTILCDEEDGPLDSEKAQSFVGLYKSILEVGGFDSCFYISHNPEVVGMADHRIVFSNAGIYVE